MRIESFFFLISWNFFKAGFNDCSPLIPARLILHCSAILIFRSRNKLGFSFFAAPKNCWILNSYSSVHPMFVLERKVGYSALF